MKAKLLEVPIARPGVDQRLEVVVGDTPSLQLLRLAEAVEGAGWTAELIPASERWNALVSQSDPATSRSFVEQMSASEGEVVFLSVSRFNWPLVAAFLTSLQQSAPAKRCRVVLAGSHRGVFSNLDGNSVSVDATLCSGYEDGAKQLLGLWATNDPAREFPEPRAGVAIKDFSRVEEAPQRDVQLSSAINQIASWRRWDNGLLTDEPFGFPLEFQPHPWNLPAEPRVDCGSLKEWLEQIESPLQAMREPLICFSTSEGVWNREFMSTLGEFSLRSIKSNGIAPIFAVRARADQLNTPSVLANLAVLNVNRVELLVGAGNDTTLGRFTDRYTLEQVRECVREMKRVGLAASTRLVFLLGLPDEGMEQAMETIDFSSNLAAENSIAELKFEWWLNVPGSSFYKPAAKSENTADGISWFADEEALTRVPASITWEDRRALASTIEFLRTLHLKMKIHGPAVI